MASLSSRGRFAWIPVITVWLGAISGCCNEATCQSGVGLGGPLTSSETPARLKVTGCRNGSCGEARLDTTTTHPPNNIVNGRFGLAEGVTVNCSLFDPRSGPNVGSWEIGIFFAAGDDTDLEDGDEYKVVIVDEDTGTELVHLVKHVDYGEQQPNGGGFCGPTCDVATLHMPGA